MEILLGLILLAIMWIGQNVYGIARSVSEILEKLERGDGDYTPELDDYSAPRPTPTSQTSPAAASPSPALPVEERPTERSEPSGGAQLTGVTDETGRRLTVDEAIARLNQKKRG